MFDESQSATTAFHTWALEQSEPTPELREDGSGDRSSPIDAVLIDADEVIKQQDREYALSKLEEEGIVERLEDGSLVCDIKKLTNPAELDYAKLAQRLGPIAKRTNGKRLVTRQQIPTYMDIFQGKEVYSKEDIQRRNEGQEVEPKPLFYIPESESAALDIDSIKNARFHLGLWELPTNKYPETIGDAPFLEATIACLTYHPQFGNGERGEDNRLVVTHPDGSRRPISGDFFKNWHFYGTGIRQDNGSYRSFGHNPSMFIAESAPKLIDNHLIDLRTDFRANEGSITASALGTNYRSPTERGLVMIDKVRYSLGSQFAGEKGYRVFKMNDTYGVIIQSDEVEGNKATHVFKLHDTNSDAQVGREVNTRSGVYVSTRRSDVNILPLEEFEDQDPLACAVVENLNTFFNFADEVSRRAKFTITHLGSTEQSYAVGAYLRFKDHPGFWQFIETHQLKGLKALMIMGGTERGATELIEAYIDVPHARELYAEAAAVLDAVAEYETSLRAKLEEEEAAHLDEASRVVLEQTQKYLLASVAAAKGEVEGIDAYDAMQLIRTFRRNVERLYMPVGGSDSGVYQHLLNLFASSNSEEHAHVLAQSMLESVWRSEIALEALKGDRNIESINDSLEKFYKDNPELFATASETTGDTQQELAQFMEFDSREPISGVLVDLGCGPAARLAKPKAAYLKGRAEVVGVDMFTPTDDEDDTNLHFIQGNLTNIPLPDNYADVAEANWSVLNDALLRSQQLPIFAEIARILKVGGRFRFDVPFLEGGEGSWESVAQAYRKEFPQERYGMIVGDFPTGSKEFYIYPQDELKALLLSHGFELDQVQEWHTQSGKPRLTLEARLRDKVTPMSLAAV